MAISITAVENFNFGYDSSGASGNTIEIVGGELYYPAPFPPGASGGFDPAFSQCQIYFGASAVCYISVSPSGVITATDGSFVPLPTPYVAVNKISFTLRTPLLPGVYNVTVTKFYSGFYGQVSATKTSGFRINPKPTISGVSPAVGSGGTAITISGTGFDKGISLLTIGGVSALSLITASTATSISLTVPDIPTTGYKTIAVKTVAGTGDGAASELASIFLYNTRATITAITPTKAVIGLPPPSVTIDGADFSAAVSAVVDGVACTSPVLVHSGRVTCTVPVHTAGTRTLTLTTGLNGTASIAFRYVYPLNGYGTMLVLEGPRPAALPLAPEPVSSVTIDAIAVSTVASLNYSAPSGRSVNTYDASGVGGGWTKDHYNQIHEGVRRIKASFDAQHAEGDGSSQITVRGMRGVLTASETVHIQPPIGTPVVVEIAEHGGEHYSGFHVLQNPTDAQGDDLDAGGLGIASLRFAFDDTKIYGVVTLVAKCHGRTNDYFARYNAYMFVPSNPVLATVAAMDLENHARRGYSIADGLYLQLLDCLEKLLALYTAEHDIVTGEHQVSLERFSGFQRLTMDVRAPTGIGGFQSYVIGSRRDRRTYFSPSLVGEPGCGIAVASIGYDQDSVLLLISRLETGDTDEFEASICSVTND